MSENVSCNVLFKPFLLLGLYWKYYKKTKYAGKKTFTLLFVLEGLSPFDFSRQRETILLSKVELLVVSTLGNLNKLSVFLIKGIV
jgi:hypothetical protein